MQGRKSARLEGCPPAVINNEGRSFNEGGEECKVGRMEESKDF